MIRNFDFEGKRIFFCGICGSSMLGIAYLCKKYGATVMGSDTCATEEQIRFLRENQIPLFFTHDKENVKGCDCFIYTAAISSDNPELIYAGASGMTVLKRSELLGAIVKSSKLSIGVCGTHGKSTVTHLLGEILIKNQFNPTVIAGAQRSDGYGSVIDGSGDVTVYEACEYSRSFLDTKPSIAVILNVEWEHVDTYPTLTDAYQAYFEFARECETCVINSDCEVCRLIAERLRNAGVRVYSFSKSETDADAYASIIKAELGRARFDIIFKDGERIDGVKTRLIGEHNVLNCLAASLTARICGATDLRSGIEGFSGLKRRMEYLGSVHGSPVYDDYAHHPTELRAVLSSARALGYERIICAFQPHTYSRTAAFFDEFCHALSLADEVLIADVYGARKEEGFTLDSEALAKGCINGKYIKTSAQMLEYLRASSNPQTLILTLGAGKMDQIGKELVRRQNDDPKGIF